MKHLFTIAVLAAAGMIPLAQAQQDAATSAAPSAKVAVIAFQAAVAKTNEGQTNFAELEKKYQPKQESINSLKTQVDTLTKQLQADGPKLTDVERATRAKTIDDKTKELDRTAQEVRTDFQQEIAKTYGALAEKVYGVLQAYAQQNGYTLVLDYSGQQSPVLFAGPTTDITNQVIAAYNTKSGVPAPAPAAQGQAVPDAPSPATTRPTGH